MKPARIRIVLATASLAAFMVIGAGCLAPAETRDPAAPYVDPLDDHAAWSPANPSSPATSGLRRNL